MKYVTSRKMQEIDRRAIEEFGIPSIVLMENAGYKASLAALVCCPERRKGRFASAEREITAVTVLF